MSRGVTRSEDVLGVTTATGRIELRPVPMKRFASKNPREWVQFQGAHVPGTSLDPETIDRVQAFMRWHGTEALTDGQKIYTLAGGRLAHCDPEVIQ